MPQTGVTKWYAHAPWQQDATPLRCVRGEDIGIHFVLFDIMTGALARDDTANLTLAQVDGAPILAIVDWRMIRYDEDEQRYYVMIETGQLAPGTYDLYIGTSLDASNRHIRIEIVEP